MIGLLTFAAALFFLPLVKPVQAMTFVYGPALLIVGVLMLQSAAKIDFEDLSEAVPAAATIAMMVFTYNIANGLTAGLALYPALKLLTGRLRDLHAGTIVLGILCSAYYGIGMVH